MGRLPPTGRQVVYTMRELSQMMGIPKRRVVRMLHSNGVKTHWSGQARVVWLSSLEQSLPEALDSIRYRYSEDD